MDDFDFDDTSLADLRDDAGEPIPDAIRNLDNELSEEILFNLIEEQAAAEVWTPGNVNYIELYGKRYNELVDETIESDEFLENKDAFIQRLLNACAFVEDKLLERFGVKIGSDPEYTEPASRFELVQHLYEFFFMRAKENVSDFVFAYMIQNKDEFKDRFKNTEYGKDLFYTMAKRQTEDPSIAFLVHFLNEIVTDIRDSELSADTYISTVCDIDPDEVTNDRIKRAFTVNYGNEGCFEDAKVVYSKIMDGIRNTDNFEECCRLVTEKLLSKTNIF